MVLLLLSSLAGPIRTGLASPMPALLHRVFVVVVAFAMIATGTVCGEEQWP
jgi:hypothetical protein